MEERDQVAVGSGSGSFIDQLQAGRGSFEQCGGNVRDPVAHVMHPRTMFVKEAGERRIVADWREQLDASLP